MERVARFETCADSYRCQGAISTDSLDICLRPVLIHTGVKELA